MEDIYFDHAATTPLSEAVFKRIETEMTAVFGNPSSTHTFGRSTRKVIDAARRTIASSVHAKEEEIIFTSGGTEAANIAIIGAALANKTKGNHIITSSVEHPAVLESTDYLKTMGFNVTVLPVNDCGVISLDDFKRALLDDTILVSVMMVNNEVGSIAPIEEIGSILKDHQALFHTDAVQAFGILPIDVDRLGVDLLSVSAHKINGPKGIGALYKRTGVHVLKRQFGGQQERNTRPGTENLLGIVGFEEAVKHVMKDDTRFSHYQSLKTLFYEQLKPLGDVVINGATSGSPLILNVSFLNTNVDQVLTNLDLNKVYVSSGSACSAGVLKYSKVLTAMYGENDPRTQSAVRFSFGVNHTTENVTEAARRVSTIIKRLRNAE